MTTTKNELELKFTRVFDAPRELVWKMWTDAKHLAKWWGPRGFTNPVCRMDARVGGKWYASMTQDGGKDHPCFGEFHELKPYERIVMTIGTTPEQHAAWSKELGETVPPFTYTITFTDDGAGKTRMTVLLEFPSAKMKEYMLKNGMKDGWSSSLDKMEDACRR